MYQKLELPGKLPNLKIVGEFRKILVTLHQRVPQVNLSLPPNPFLPILDPPLICAHFAPYFGHKYFSFWS